MENDAPSLPPEMVPHMKHFHFWWPMWGETRNKEREDVNQERRASGLHILLSDKNCFRRVLHFSLGSKFKLNNTGLSKSTKAMAVIEIRPRNEIILMYV